MSALCVLHFVLCCMISCGLSIQVVRFFITGFVSCCSCVSIYNCRRFILVLSSVELLCSYWWFIYYSFYIVGTIEENCVLSLWRSWNLPDEEAMIDGLV